jgi:hypothetical protein
MYSFGNFQQQEVVYVRQETNIFPEYLVLIPTFTKEGTLGYVHYIYFFSKVPGKNIFDPIFINFPVI